MKQESTAENGTNVNRTSLRSNRTSMSYIFTDLDQPHVCPWMTLKSHDVIVYILKIGKQKPQNDYALASRLTTLAARPRATTSRLRALAARPIMFDP